MSASLKLMKYSGKVYLKENVVMVLVMAIISTLIVMISPIVPAGEPSLNVLPIVRIGFIMFGLHIILIIYSIRQMTGMIDLSRNFGITRLNYFIFNLISSLAYAVLLSLILMLLEVNLAKYESYIHGFDVEALETLNILSPNKIFLENITSILFFLAIAQTAAFTFKNFGKYALIIIPLIVIGLNKSQDIEPIYQIIAFIISQAYIFIGLKKFK